MRGGAGVHGGGAGSGKRMPQSWSPGMALLLTSRDAGWTGEATRAFCVGTTVTGSWALARQKCRQEDIAGCEEPPLQHSAP